MSEAYDLYQQGLASCDRVWRRRRPSRSRRRKRLEPEKASIREALGIAYFRITDWVAAEREFRKVLELSPVDDYAHYALGRSLLRQGRSRRLDAPQAGAVAAPRGPREPTTRTL